MSKSRLGRIVSPETKEKISKSHLGKKLKKETKKKISQKLKGKTYKPKGDNHHYCRKYEITFNTGVTIVIIGKKEWCKNNGYLLTGRYKVQTKKWKRYKDIISVKEVV